MEKLISNKRDLLTVPESYILPPDSRPQINSQIPFCQHTNIPVIDLKPEFGHSPTNLIHQIIDASTEFGFFQLINHGIDEKLLEDVLRVSKEFFDLPDEEKSRLFSDDPKRSCRLYTSIDYINEDVHYWKDTLKHPCHPLEEHRQFWPEKPARYKEVVGRYSVEARKLSSFLLDLIGEGLGLEPGYFRDETELAKSQTMAFNHYPPCPDPSLTLGLPKHSDPNLITLLLQEMDGLQVLKDGQWLAVKPLPNAFVVNLGHTLQVARTTIASFVSPSSSVQIEPAKVLVNDQSPPLYTSFIYKDFIGNYVEDTHQRKLPLDRYKLGF